MSFRLAITLPQRRPSLTSSPPLAALPLLPMPQSSPAAGDSAYLVYVGTYTDMIGPMGRKSEGIYVYRMDPETGRLTFDSVATNVVRPSFLALHPTSRYLYAVNEIADQSGGVTAFAIDPRSGRLTFLNQQPSQGAASCHLTVDSTGRFVMTASFGSGNLALLPIAADGRLLPATQVIQHLGAHETPESHTAARAHMITQDPSHRFVLVPDLGLDQLFIYQFDAATGTLRPHIPPHVSVQAGAGPRHLDFHPSGRYAYLINELDATINVYAYEPTAGHFDILQTVSTLPEGYDGQRWCADIHVAPSGRFMYGSNRGHDSLVVFAIDHDTGRLTLVGHTPTGGKTPRNFGLDPRGRFLIVANQDSDNLVVFAIDPETGQLSPTGEGVEVPAPVCVKFLIPREAT